MTPGGPSIVVKSPHDGAGERRFPLDLADEPPDDPGVGDELCAPNALFGKELQQPLQSRHPDTQSIFSNALQLLSCGYIICSKQDLDDPVLSDAEQQEVPAHVKPKNQ